MAIVKRVRKSGNRYQVKLRDPNDNEKWLTETFRTKALAEKFERNVLSANDQGTYVDHRLAETPFAVIADDWLKSDGTKTGGALARDRSILKTHVLPTLGQKTVGTVTRVDVQKLVNTWVTTHAPSSVNRMYSTLRAVFSYAVDSECIGRNPCRNIKLPEAPPRLAQLLNHEDLDRLAQAMGDSGPMLYLAALGPRWGEIAGLRIRDIDFPHQIIWIVNQRTRGEKGRMVEQDPKNKQHRHFKVDLWVTQMLAAHLEKRGLTGVDRDALVFSSPEGHPLHYSNWRRNVWLPALEKAGFHDLHFHDVRKTAASILVNEKVDIKTAQQRLGHTEQVMLRIYAQPMEEADVEAAEKVAARIRPRKVQ